MSLIPAFELGVWNACIFMGPFLLVTLLCMFMMMKKGVPDGSVRAVQRACKSKTTLLVASLSKIIYFPAVIYSVFLPLQVGTIWFYVGLPITLIGLVRSILVRVDWLRTPAGQPVTRGMYRALVLVLTDSLSRQLTRSIFLSQPIYTTPKLYPIPAKA